MSVTAVPIPPVKTGYKVWIWLGVLAAVAAGILLALHGTAKVVADKGTNAQFLAWNRTQPGVVETQSGLQIQVLKPGEGPKATEQDVALIQYVGRLRDGRIFDRSERPTPLPVGSGTVPGFAEALKLMQKGGKYRLWLKPELAYGERSPNPDVIPAGSLLIFDVEMKDFMSMQAFQQQMQMMQMMQQQQQGAAPGGPPPAER